MLEKLENIISNNQLLSENLFIKNNLEELLMLRENKNFDEKWIKIYNVLNVNDYSNKKELIDRIRKIVFRRAYDISFSSEFAGFVSDDFELISKAIICKYENSWITSLLYIYLKGNFPTGEIKIVSNTFNEIITDATLWKIRLNFEIELKKMGWC